MELTLTIKDQDLTAVITLTGDIAVQMAKAIPSGAIMLFSPPNDSIAQAQNIIKHSNRNI